MTVRTRGIFGISTTVGFRGFSSSSLYLAELKSVGHRSKNVYKGHVPEIFCVIHLNKTTPASLCQAPARGINFVHDLISPDHVVPHCGAGFGLKSCWRD